MQLDEFTNTLKGIGIKIEQSIDKNYIYKGYINFYNDDPLYLCEYNSIEASAKVFHHKFTKFLENEKEVLLVNDNIEGSITEYLTINNFREALLNEFKFTRSVISENNERRRA